MSRFTVTNAANETRQIDIRTGLSLMEHLRDAGYDEIAALCGGVCSCATCHVHIVTGGQKLPPVEDIESDLLEMEDDYDPAQSRLSCQLEMDDSLAGLHVQLLDNSAF